MIVFVDGENFRQNLTKELVEKRLIKRYDTLYKYDVIGLLRDALLTDDIEVWYYASEAKMPQGYEPGADIVEQMRKIEKRAAQWVPMLEKQGIKYIRAGNLKPKMAPKCRNCGTQEEIIQEKGVDVRMALDIFEECLEPSCEEIAVMSSDVDLCPAFRKARRHWTKIRYVCFSDRINKAINACCYRTMTIPPKMIKAHFEGVVDEGVDAALAMDEYIDEN